MKAATSLLIFCVAALLTLGLVTLSSVGTSKGGAHYPVMQLIWGGAGLLVATVLAMLDYRLLKRAQIPWLLLGISVLLLILVYVLGNPINGARRWFQYGGVNFQPSELAKLAVIIALSFYGHRYQRHMGSFWRGLVIPALMLGVVLALIFIEPDRGATILLGTVGLTLLILAGAKLRYILPPIPVAVAALAYSIWHDPVRWKRIECWLDPEKYKDTPAGSQVWHSMVAIGSGGWQGLGLGNGRQKYGFVPEHQTDFVLAVIGEELGLIATLGVIVAFGLLVFCGIQIARRAPDTFGFLLAGGITFLIGLQAAINIGVVTGALPNKGLPLPFISYGGSNLLLMLACIGLLLSVARQASLPGGDLPADEESPELMTSD